MCMYTFFRSLLSVSLECVLCVMGSNQIYMKKDNIDDELVSMVWLTNVTNHQLICLTSIKNVRPLHYDHKLIDFLYKQKKKENKQSK